MEHQCHTGTSLVDTPQSMEARKHDTNNLIGKPKLSFGIIADVQYADMPDGTNYRKTKNRYYRNSLRILQNAVDVWNKHEQDVSFVLQLGDIIDGFNKRHKMTASALDEVLRVLESLDRPVHHVCGNHEFYNFSRRDLIASPLNSSHLAANPTPPNKDGTCPLYYHFTPVTGFRVVILDTYEISMLGYENDSPCYQEAERIIRPQNHNKDMNSGEGMRGMEKRLVKLNGAVSERQLEWLERVLKEADRSNENVLVAGHIPMYVYSSCATCLCWNYEDVLTTMRRHPCVKAYVCGHDHSGGWAWDARDILHMTLPGVIETEPGQDCFGLIHLYDDKMVVEGYGLFENLTVMFRNAQAHI